MYVGKAKSWFRYLARQGEHNREKGIKHEFKILDRAEDGCALCFAEETQIRAAGLKKEGGTLVNKIHAMSDRRYDAFQGIYRVSGRIEAAQIDRLKK